MRTRIGLAALSATFFVCVCGCQAAPDSTAVTSKNDGALEAALEAAADVQTEAENNPVSIQEPVTYTDSFTLPSEVLNVVSRYYDELLKDIDDIDPKVIEECMYWKSEEERSLTLDNLYPIIEYRIDGAERINDSVYAIKLLIRDEAMPMELLQDGSYQVFYTFTVQVNGRWYICSQRNIPSDLTDGYDMSQYALGIIMGNINGIDVVVPEYYTPQDE